MKFWKKKKIIIIGVIISLALVGGTFALNGWFGGGASIPSDTMTRGLVGYWNFDEGTGATSTDASGNGNDGTLTSGPSWAKGKVGGALTFDGTNDYVDVADNASLYLPTGLSVETWVKLTSGKMMSKSNLDGTQREWQLNGDSFEVFDQSAGGAVYIGRNFTALSAGVWHHVAVTWNGGVTSASVKVYIDGVRADTTNSEAGTFVNMDDGTATLKIGVRESDGYLNGLLDEVRIYNRVLSAEEIRYHYNRGGPVALWKFDEGSGLTAYDASGNANTGTLQNNMATTSWTSGKYGSALNFDGVDDYVDVSNTTTTSRTISFWLNRQDSTNRDVIDLGTPEIKISSNAITSTGLTLPTYYVDGVPGTTLKTNAWQHISITDTADTTISPNLVDIGKASTNYFSGLLDDVRIYNYARTADEIRLDYNAGFAALFGPQTDCDTDPGSCMTKGLVGQWSMDEGAGTTTADISGNNNTGVSLTATGSPAWTSGKVGGALSFDGSDDYVDAGNAASLDFTTAITIEAWVKMLSFVSPGEVDGIVNKFNGAANQGFYLLVLGSQGIRFVVGYGTANDLLNTTNTVSPNVWTHIVATLDGSDNLMKVYLNGVQDPTTKSRTSPLTMVVTDNLKIGQKENGLIDEVRVYNRTLSAEEVSYHYNRGGPVALWKFDEGSGLTAYDASGNANTGTLQNNMATTSWTSGKYGSALNFDGVDDYADVSNTTTTSRTISFWLNRQDSADRDVIDLGTPEIKISSNAITSTGLTLPTYYVDSVPGTTLKTNVWQHISITDTADTTISPNLIDIGKASTNYFSGLLDDVRIYNYARTPEQILQDYNAGFAAKFGGGLSSAGCDRDPGSCMTKGLVGQWSMDEGTGTTTADISGNNNTGIFQTVAASPAWTRGSPAPGGGGVSGSALNFDGVDDYVSVGDASGITSVYSIEAWIKIASSTGTGQTIFGGTTLAYAPDIQINSTNYPRIVADVNDGYLLSANALNNNTWYHYVAVFNGKYKAIYINGVLDIEETDPTYTAGWDSAGHLIGAKDATPTSFFNGLIDEVRIYNRALSAAEVRYHYNRGGPVALWKFDEGSGLTAYDASGQANTGTLQNNMATTSWTSGKYGSALNFDGVDDYVDVSNTTTTSRTVSFWLNRQDTANRDVIDLGTPEIKISSNAITSTGLTSPTYYVDGIPGTTLKTNVWQHISITDTADISINVNIIDIGRASTNYFSGLLDDVRIYNYARTPEQILQDYNMGKAIQFR